jgi:hypothetical protein
MKTIYDIFTEECCNATPANTAGMGNPMAPTDTECGTEPLVGKCKKEKNKKHKKTIKEGILAGQDEVLKQGDATMDDMCLFHWRFGKSYRYKVYKNIPGSLGGVFKKHFTKKPATIYTAWPADPIAKHFDTRKIPHDKYGIDYLYAIILSTKLPKPIDSYNLYNFKDLLELKNEVELQLRSYMLDDSRKFRTTKNNWPVLTVNFHASFNRIEVSVYYHQNDIKNESQLLCDLEFNMNTQ